MLSRRQFFSAAATGVALSRFNGGWLARAEAAAGKRLVVVFLRGAVDGLSLVVPYGDDDYYSARRSIALKPPGAEGGVLDLDGRFGLHPALSSLMPLWRQQSLAFVQAVGSPDPTRSHFDAQLYMENGTPGRGASPDGWMNRLLAQLPGPVTASRAIAFGPQMPRILAGAQPVANMALGEAATRKLAVDRPGVSEAFAQLYGGDDKLSRSFQEGVQSRLQMSQDLGMEDAEQRAADGGAPPPNGFPGDAARLARMMRQDPSISMAFLALGGWDTHIRQGAAEGQLAGHLRPLSDGLAKLAEGLGPAWSDTLVLVMTEFGRTVQENGNGGTDHGHGSVMTLLGGAVAGGQVYGNWPGLREDHLYQQRDLAVTTDFRAVIGPAVTRHFSLPPASLASLFPNSPPLAGLPSLLRS